MTHDDAKFISEGRAMPPDRCKVNGCNGWWGPACYVSQGHPEFFKCQGNKDFLGKVFNSAKFGPTEIKGSIQERFLDRMEHDA